MEKTQDYLNIHELLRAKREALGLSQMDLSSRSDFYQADISKWENGKAPMPGTLRKLCKELNISALELGQALLNE